jgi:hypothetical protein
MNSFYKQMNAVLFCAAVATIAPLHGMENETVSPEQQTEMVPAIWYKKRSVQVAAVAITTAVAAYALAVRMDKVSSPAVLAGMICALVAKDAVKQSDTNVSVTDSQDANTHIGEQQSDVEVEIAEVVVTEEAVTQEANLFDNVWNTKLNGVKKTFSDVVAKYLNHERTAEAFDKINDDLNQ